MQLHCNTQSALYSVRVGLPTLVSHVIGCGYDNKALLVHNQYHMICVYSGVKVIQSQAVTASYIPGSYGFIYQSKCSEAPNPVKCENYMHSIHGHTCSQILLWL